MKKLFSILLAVMMLCSVLALAGCGDKPGQTDEKSSNDADVAVTEKDEAEAPTAEPAEPEEPEEPVEPDYVPESLEVVNIYTTYGEDSQWLHYLLIVKNISDETLEVNCKAVAYDAQGNQVKEDTAAKMRALGAGETSYLIVNLVGVPADVKVRYELSAEPADHYDDYISKLTVSGDIEEYNADTKNVTVSVTNDSDAPAKNVSAVFVCLDANGEYVTFRDVSALWDDDMEIKPGATQSRTIGVPIADGDFETVEVYIQGSSVYKD
ncbi:MAG: hypothetical protein K6G90_12050 [Clostridia bacterium]|nr:hypothetical protein [Clostridia bacterium]